MRPLAVPALLLLLAVPAPPEPAALRQHTAPRLPPEAPCRLAAAVPPKAP